VEIGTYENWIALNDHTPLIVNFDLWQLITKLWINELAQR
jgi:hypothetical protein